MIDDFVPTITIQLPVYNELYVMERLLKNISKLEYPREKLEIQVLDDSTDESLITTAEQVKLIKEKGIDIQHIRRSNRQGFKAGALKEGLKTAKGEFGSTSFFKLGLAGLFFVCITLLFLIFLLKFIF